mgnify:CR=1 FL=1|jgi:hypothetical protein
MEKRVDWGTYPIEIGMDGDAFIIDENQNVYHLSEFMVDRERGVAYQSHTNSSVLELVVDEYGEEGTLTLVYNT